LVAHEVLVTRRGGEGLTKYQPSVTHHVNPEIDRHGLLSGAQSGRNRSPYQFLLLTAVLVFSAVTRPSANPHGSIAGIAVMIAVSAMACQYALLRWAIPGAISMAVMTGNLTNTVLSPPAQ